MKEEQEQGAEEGGRGVPDESGRNRHECGKASAAHEGQRKVIARGT